MLKTNFVFGRKKYGDWLQFWIQDNFEKMNPVYINKTEENLLEKYRNVMEYINSSGLYPPESRSEWSNEKCADPWLIAAAIAHGHTIVSMEKPKEISSKHTKNNSPKIPDVANYFGVEHINIFDMMRALKIVL
ncbi:MAG: DUF4411 family protein [Methanosarcinaceae archaeon]|nr:DUF4411 family protein [Methanosarcinaceae archaeon]